MRLICLCTLNYEVSGWLPRVTELTRVACEHDEPPHAVSELGALPTDYHLTWVGLQKINFQNP